MAEYGIRIWDASGNTILDENSRIGKVVNRLSLPANASGTVSVPKLAVEDAWATLASSNSATNPKSTVSITGQGGTTATIHYSLGPASAYLIYGVY